MSVAVDGIPHRTMTEAMRLAGHGIGTGEVSVLQCMSSTKSARTDTLKKEA